MQMRTQQQGFTLIELAVTFALMTVAIVGSLSMFEYSRRVDQGRAVGKHMLALSAALIEYKTQNKDSLMSLPLACGQPTYRVGGALPEPSVGVYPRGHPLEGRSLCAMAVPREGQSDFVVDNGMQPTYQELIAVGVLAPSNNGNLVLPTDSNRIVRANNLARTNVYAFLLQRECKARTCNPQTGPFNLQSWVFNLQPYRIDQRLFGSGARIGAAVAAMDGQGYLSPVGGDGSLRNLFNNYIATNPVVEANGTGAVGILAAYDGWGLGNERFAYRDGTRPPTADWNFDDYSLVGVKDFNSKSATIGTATVNTATVNTATINTAMIGTDTSAPVSDRLANRNAITNARALLAKGHIVSTGSSGVYTNNLNTVQDVVAGGNVGGNSLTSSTTINAGSNITAGGGVAVGGALSVGGDAQINGNTRVLKDFGVGGTNTNQGGDGFSVSNGLVKAAKSGEFEGGYNGGAVIGTNSSVMNLQMRRGANFGDACNTSVDSFARHSSYQWIMLICDRNKWRKVGPDIMGVTLHNYSNFTGYFRVSWTLGGSKTYTSTSPLISGPVAWSAIMPGLTKGYTVSITNSGGTELVRQNFTNADYDGAYSCIEVTRLNNGSMYLAAC